MFAPDEVMDLSQEQPAKPDHVDPIVDNDNHNQYNVDTQQEVDPHVERASKEGWVPKEQFKGDPSRWVDAKTYVERGEVMRPLKDEIARLRREHEAERAQMFKAMSDVQRIAKEDAERKIAEYEAGKKAAFEAGDYNRFNAFEKAQREIERTIPQQVPVRDPSQDEEAMRAAEDFKQANEWFERDPQRTEAVRQYVAGELGRAQAEGRYVSPIEFRGLLDKAAKTFGAGYTPTAPRTAVTPTSNARPAPKENKRFDSLSQEEKTTFEQLYRRGVFKRAKSIADAREAYAKEIANETPYIGR